MTITKKRHEAVDQSGVVNHIVHHPLQTAQKGHLHRHAQGPPPIGSEANDELITKDTLSQVNQAFRGLIVHPERRVV